MSVREISEMDVYQRMKEIQELDAKDLAKIYPQDVRSRR